MATPFAYILLTRPEPAARAFWSQEFGRGIDGVEPIFSPLLEIVPTKERPQSDQFAGVIFTSAQGVRFGGNAVDRPAYCVGHATTRAAENRGWKSQFCGETASELIETLSKIRPPDPLLHIGGVHRRGNVAENLNRAGLKVRQIDVYDQSLLALTEDAQKALAGERPVFIPLFSPRTARQFSRVAKPLAPIHLVSLSPTIDQEVADVPALSRCVAPAPNAQSLGLALRNLVLALEARGAPH